MTEKQKDSLWLEAKHLLATAIWVFDQADEKDKGTQIEAEAEKVFGRQFEAIQKQVTDHDGCRSRMAPEDAFFSKTAIPYRTADAWPTVRGGYTPEAVACRFLARAEARIFLVAGDRDSGPDAWKAGWRLKKLGEDMFSVQRYAEEYETARRILEAQVEHSQDDG